MIINENTKLIGRFHKQVSPRGLNIYNPTFQELDVNAVYMLFVYKEIDKLLEAMRTMNMAGAVAIGFEKEEGITSLLDELDETAKFVDKVGYIKNINGKLTGYNQGGYGLLQAIEEATDLTGKKVVLVGAGNVAKGLLFALSKRDYKVKEVEIYNRTESKAKELKEKFDFVSSVHALADLESASGDILVNATEIGSNEGETFFSEDLVSRFETVVDVTFEIKDTELIKAATKLGKKVVTGWEFFTYQGLVVLETILDQKIDVEVLRKHVYAGLSKTVV
jgi:shikimate dehydrogenase